MRAVPMKALRLRCVASKVTESQLQACGSQQRGAHANCTVDEGTASTSLGVAHEQGAVSHGDQVIQQASCPTC